MPPTPFPWIAKTKNLIMIPGWKCVKMELYGRPERKVRKMCLLSETFYNNLSTCVFYWAVCILLKAFPVFVCVLSAVYLFLRFIYLKGPSGHGHCKWSQAINAAVCGTSSVAYMSLCKYTFEESETASTVIHFIIVFIIFFFLTFARKQLADQIKPHFGQPGARWINSTTCEREKKNVLLILVLVVL